MSDFGKHLALLSLLRYNLDNLSDNLLITTVNHEPERR